ncbi:MAG TPA: GDP-mannose 4,6-dehydratase [Geobacteraceae bacterium]|nr:GDP-mannose 4,6-dehydratase [Geobacteraceae bacterium]
MRILVTGGAGFIGSHLCERLVATGHDLIVIDNFNDFYDPALKRRNIGEVAAAAAAAGRDFILCEGDIRDGAFVAALFAQEAPDAVIHLAAAAGVRPSIERPLFYEEVNVRGTMHLLEAARTAGIAPFVFASSSSVYGNSPKVPFAESDPVDHPISPYAATKKAGELVCHTYHHLYGMNIACLRFFTVYGPRQRPDLAISKFTRLILEGKSIPFYGDGSTSRDYTYVDDIVAGVERALGWACGDGRRFDIFNLGESQPVELSRLLAIIEAETGEKARIEWLPPQAGDVERTYADITKSSAVLGYRPQTTIEDGIRAFVRWYRENR